MADELKTRQDPIPADASTVPDIDPLSGMPETNEKHHAMGAVLTRAIQEGKHEVPEVPAPLVCKPRQLESWRVFKIMSEFVEGFDVIQKYGLAASFFGTARQSFDQSVYDAATELAGRLAKSGFAIITGGSDGIMEAANKGAYEAGGDSIGLNIELDMEQAPNTYLTEMVTFHHFFVRKVMLTFASEVYVYFPGGFGTLDEFSEIVTLVQTKKIRKVPIVLYGKEYWDPFIKIFEERLYKEYKAVDEADLDLYKVVDTVDEAYEYIMANVKC
ncbi:MAG TPA: TIGR00730 family Rossman fold protein [Candidatus Paceibacterota bacterium]|nr:TIGR00730 family Rossman fold protein [Candidatus Paceibacterota bacterium]